MGMGTQLDSKSILVFRSNSSVSTARSDSQKVIIVTAAILRGKGVMKVDPASHDGASHVSKRSRNTGKKGSKKGGPKASPRRRYASLGLASEQGGVHSFEAIDQLGTKIHGCALDCYDEFHLRTVQPRSFEEVEPYFKDALIEYLPIVLARWMSGEARGKEADCLRVIEALFPGYIEAFNSNIFPVLRLLSWQLSTEEVSRHVRLLLQRAPIVHRIPAERATKCSSCFRIFCQ